MLHAWVIWFLSAMFMCYKYAIEVSPSVMTADLMREWGLTGAQMGNFAACYFYAYLLLQIPAGLLIDRWGPRRVTTVAIGLCALGTLLFAGAESVWMACLGRFVTGVGAAFAAVNCLKLIANWFPAGRFALMAGLMMTVGMLGAVCGQGPLARFIGAMGWREAMSFLALGGVVLGGLFWLVVRNRAPHHREYDVEVERVGKNLGVVVKNPQAWLLSLYSGLAFAPVSAFGGLWGVPFLSEAFGMGKEAAAQGSSLIFLGFAAGAPLFGWLSDRLGRRKGVMGWGTLVALACLAVVLYLPGMGQGLVYGLLFAMGFSISSFLLCFTMIKEAHWIGVAATAMGFMNGFDALFGAVSDPLTGKVLDVWWSGEMVDGARVFSVDAYRIGLLILVVYFVVALALLRWIRETHCKQTVPAGMP